MMFFLSLDSVGLGGIEWDAVGLKRKVSWSVDAGVAERVSARAASERRPVSQMASLLLEEALESKAPGSTGVNDSGLNSGEGERAAPRSSSARKGMCEHRIPTDQFCKRCDS